MAFNYDEAIHELRSEEVRLERELKQIRDAIPAMVLLRNRAKASAAKEADLQHLPGWKTPGMKFAGMGATKAIPLLLKDAPMALTTGEVLDALKANGWTTEAKRPVSTVSATLIQLAEDGVVEKVGDGWRPKTEQGQPAGITDEIAINLWPASGSRPPS